MTTSSHVCDRGWLTTLEPYPYHGKLENPNVIYGHYPLDMVPELEPGQDRKICTQADHRGLSQPCEIVYKGSLHEVARPCPVCKPDWVPVEERKW